MTTIICPQLFLRVLKETENQGSCVNSLNNKHPLAQLSVSSSISIQVQVLLSSSFRSLYHCGHCNIINNLCALV